jgi:hypothetical protein
MKIFFLAPLIFVNLFWGSASAFSQKMPIMGDSGWDDRVNAAWFDLATASNFQRGQSLEIHFSGASPTAVIARFRAQGSSVTARGQIIGNCTVFQVHNGLALVTLNQDYKQIVQISVHSGVNGRAWDCRVSGGPISEISTINVQ